MKLACCKPTMRPWPSGWAYAHAADCPVDPDQKVQPQPKPPKRETEHLRLVQHGEDSRASVPTRVPRGAVHPACKAAATEGAIPCAQCAWRMGLDTDGARYIEAWVDA